jgi:AraC-like DNA-binding protein
LLSIILFLKNSNHLTSRILGAYVFVFSLGMLENFLKENLTGISGQLVYSFLGLSNFLYGPLLFLFVHFLTVKEPAFKAKHLLHFLPFSFLYGLDTVLILFAQQTIQQEVVELILFETLIIQMLVYNFSAIFKLKKYGKEILQIHSNLEMKDLNWLKFLVIFLTGVYILSFAITHAIAFGFKSAEQLYVLVQFFITAAIYLMSYRLLLQPQLFMLNKFPEKIPEDSAKVLEVINPEKYQRSGLKPEQAEQQLQILLAFMKKEKPYLNPELTIHTLAEKLTISRNHLTEIINEKLAKNFFEFINAYRVEEVKLMLTDFRYSHLNLYALGLEAGFKSKSAFNANFKKITGFTPRDWKQQYSPDTPTSLNRN